MGDPAHERAEKDGLDWAIPMGGQVGKHPLIVLRETVARCIDEGAPVYTNQSADPGDKCDQSCCNPKEAA